MITSRSRKLALIVALCATACQRQAPETDVPADTPNQAPNAEAPTPSPEPAPAPTSDVLTADGWRALRIGMTRSEVVAAAGEDANPNAVGGADPAQCDQFRPTSAPKGLLVMIEQGRLTRISVSAPAAIKTDRGFAVGDAAAAVKSAYGADAQVGLHKYSAAPAEYITVWTKKPPAPDARGIVYEIGTDGRVQHIHAGGSSIQYVEGCL
jgi:hypothetical protein